MTGDDVNVAERPVGADDAGLNGIQAEGGDLDRGPETAVGASDRPDDAEGGAGAPDAQAAQPEASGAAEAGPSVPEAGEASKMTPEEAEQVARIGRGRGTLARALEEFRPFHSAYQIERFILTANGPTVWGAFVQAAREIATRVEAIKLDYIAAGRAQLARRAAIEDAEDRGGEYAAALQAATKKFRAINDDAVREAKVERETRKQARALKTAELDRSEAILKLDGIRRTIADRERELGEFLAHFAALRDELEAHGPLTPERRADLEAELWRERVRLAAVSEAVGIGGITSETLGMIAALDHGDRREVLAFLNDDREKLQEWLLSRSRPTGPTSGALPFEEVRALLCS